MARRISKQRLWFKVALVALVMAPALAQADLYRYETPDGELLLTNKPMAGMKLLSHEVHGRGGEVTSSASSAPSGRHRASLERATAARLAHLATPQARLERRYLESLPRHLREHAYDDIIREASEAYRVPFSFIKGVIRIESNFNPHVVSHAGAQGLMQLMPSTASGLNVTDAFDPRQNIFGGARLLRKLIDQYDGDINLVLAAYNAGPGNVARYNGIPWAKTRQYVASVYHWYKIYSAMDATK